MIRAGLNPYLLEMANIRNMDSWVHKFAQEAATYKAMDMVWMAVEKARQLVPLSASQLPLIQRALVVGGGIAGMTAAAALARQGFAVLLVRKHGVTKRFTGCAVSDLVDTWTAGGWGILKETDEAVLLTPQALHK